MQTKYLFCTFILSFVGMSFLMATNYYSNGSRTWNSSGFPNPIPAADTVFIIGTDVVSLNQNLNINGVLVIEATASITGAKKLTILTTGYTYSYGTINITKELHIDGSWYNQGISYAEKVHNDGYICNSNLIQCQAGKKYDGHGGTLECNGTILADKVKFHDNGGTPHYTSATNLCDYNNTGNPTFESPVSETEFLNNTDPSNSIINLANVAICDPLVLPVNLLSFKGYLDGQFVLLEWTTGSELNSDFFLVQRSYGGGDWEDVDIVEALGTGDFVQSYSFEDRITEDYVYYRLEQIDLDGSSYYSNILYLRTKLGESGKNKLYPNPTSDYLTIDSLEGVGLKVYDISGVEYSSFIKVVNFESDELTLDVSTLPAGMFFVQQGNTSFRFVKK